MALVFLGTFSYNNNHAVPKIFANILSYLSCLARIPNCEFQTTRTFKMYIYLNRISKQ